MSLSAWVLLVLFPSACRVVHPLGYEALRSQPPEVIQATPRKWFGTSANSWNLPDGRQVVLERQPELLGSDPRVFSNDVAFSVALTEAPGAPWMACASDLYAPDLPQTRFGCWTEDAEVQSGFWFNHSEDCVIHGFNALKAFTQPTCWTGQLKTPTHDYRIAFAHTAKAGLVINRVSWADASGTVVQAADLVAEVRVKLYRPQAISAHDQDLLRLHALALHRYVHSIGD